jgi:hypothetical protein
LSILRLHAVDGARVSGAGVRRLLSGPGRRRDDPLHRPVRATTRSTRPVCCSARRRRSRCRTMLVGGGFGGKEDVTVQHHAALIAYLTGAPSRSSSPGPSRILIHPKRHPFWMDFTIGCDENGIIQGVKAKVVSDTGAFASLGGPVLERACTHAAGPYAYREFRDRRHRLLHEQPARGRVPRLRRDADLLLRSRAAQRDGRQGRHQPVRRSACATPSARAACCPTGRSWGRRRAFWRRSRP